jgi:hypothetical protein
MPSMMGTPKARFQRSCRSSGSASPALHIKRTLEISRRCPSGACSILLIRVGTLVNTGLVFRFARTAKLRCRLLAKQRSRRAHGEREHQIRARCIAEKQPRAGNGHVAFAHADESLGVDFRVEREMRVAVHRAFALTGGAAGEQPDGGIVLARRPGFGFGSSLDPCVEILVARGVALTTITLSALAAAAMARGSAALSRIRAGSVRPQTRIAAAHSSDNIRSPRRQQRIDLGRDRARLDGAEPRIGEFRADPACRSTRCSGSNPSATRLRATRITLSATVR